jgi:hypothetical protein
MSRHRFTRRWTIGALPAAPTLLFEIPLATWMARAAEADDAALIARFNYLSQNGNSNCSSEFMKSIAGMPASQRLQGSCCSAMDATRNIQQVKGLRAHKSTDLIPADPYDIPARLAQKLMGSYDLKLTASEQAGYDFAMASSAELGLCCCACWRWQVYGGLG